MTLAMFQDSTELTAAYSMMRTAYPNLDLQDAWNAFSVRHYDGIRTVGIGYAYGVAGVRTGRKWVVSHRRSHTSTLGLANTR